MRRILALTILVLLATGLAFQLRADPERWECPWDHSYNTWSEHVCSTHEEFRVECWSEGGNPPPDPAACTECTGGPEYPAVAAYCHSDLCKTLGPFWVP